MTEVTFIGTGARWPAELAKLGHPANALYDSVRDVVKGVSCGCATVFGATEGVESTGNIAVNDRVSLFLMDYPRRERLKILGHARVADASSELVEQLVEPNAGPSVERLFFIDVISFDWNCPKYITPRYTTAQVEEVISPLKRRIAELEAELRELKNHLRRDFPSHSP